MRTSGSCPQRAEGCPPPRAGGFTLLELLVVLALVAMMAALTVPRLQRTVTAIASSGERAEVVRQLERLPLLARRDGRAIEIAADESPAAYLQLPQGWETRAITPLRVAANGICSAARIRVSGADGVETWSLAAPDCRVDPHGD